MDIVSVPGRLVRDPVTMRVVDKTPLTINASDPHWVRLLRDGDVQGAPDVAAAPAESADPAPAPDAAPGTPKE